MSSQGIGVGGHWEGLNREEGKVIQGFLIGLVTFVSNWGSVPPESLWVECASELSAQDIEVFISWFVSIIGYAQDVLLSPSSFQVCAYMPGWSSGLLQAFHREGHRSPGEECKRRLMQLGQGALKLPFCVTSCCSGGQTKNVIWEDVRQGTWDV